MIRADNNQNLIQVRNNAGELLIAHGRTCKMNNGKLLQQQYTAIVYQVYSILIYLD